MLEHGGLAHLPRPGNDDFEMLGIASDDGLERPLDIHTHSYMFLKSGTCSAFEIFSGIGWLEKRGLLMHAGKHLHNLEFIAIRTGSPLFRMLFEGSRPSFSPAARFPSKHAGHDKSPVLFHAEFPMMVFCDTIVM